MTEQRHPSVLATVLILLTSGAALVALAAIWPLLRQPGSASYPVRLTATPTAPAEVTRRDPAPASGDEVTGEERKALDALLRNKPGSR